MRERLLVQAMGMKLTMEEGAGPQFSWRIDSPADVEKLDLQPDVEKTLGKVEPGEGTHVSLYAS